MIRPSLLPYFESYTDAYDRRQTPGGVSGITRHPQAILFQKQHLIIIISSPIAFAPIWIGMDLVRKGPRLLVDTAIDIGIIAV